MANPLYKLKKITVPGEDGPRETGKYRAITIRRDTLGTDWILKKMIERYPLKMSSNVVKSIVNSVLESMIERTLEDGETIYNISVDGGLIENTPERLVAEWPQHLTPDKANPSMPNAIFSIWSSGGKEGAQRRGPMLWNRLAA